MTTWNVEVKQRSGYVVQTEDGMTHVLQGGTFEDRDDLSAGEFLRFGDEVEWTMETGPWTEERRYVGRVIGMVLAVSDCEREHDEF